MATILPEIRLRSVGEDGSVYAPHYGGLRRPTLWTYWRTLGHLRSSQLGYLALRRVLRRKNSVAELNSPVSLRKVPAPYPFAVWQPEASRKMLTTREFTFLNRTVACNGTIPWGDRRHAKLWLYHLNYFAFLNVDVALPEEEPALKSALAIMLDWCACNPKGNEVGWEPYALSLRIVNWLKFLVRNKHLMESREHAPTVCTLVENLGVQAATLELRLEKDLLGNHFLKNIKALLFAGALLDSQLSKRWWTKGQKLLEQQLHEQILADGGHFERSPMYHGQILEDLTEIRLLCRGLSLRLICNDLLSQKIDLMAHFLRDMLHPDGEIPLFNDSVLGGARKPAQLLRPAESPESSIVENTPHTIVFPETGYGVIHSLESKSAIIFDCGRIGPDYQPGHGHCDLLSYELSLHGQRVVVDGGVSTYEPGLDRSFERSTAAHNTIRIDGEEQAETWASFRVGRRPRVGKIQSGNFGPFHFLSGEHYAYEHLGVTHARTILHQAPDTWIVADSVQGHGVHLVESFLHFHPRIHIQQVDENMAILCGMPLRRWTMRFAEQHYCLTICGQGESDLCMGWYAERFGERQRGQALRWTCRGSIPTRLIYIFTPAGTSLPDIATDWKSNSFAIDGLEIPLR